MKKKIVALVGKPNVGKSTLFNRLSNREKAIVYEDSGVTRDRKYSDARIGSMEFIIVDTPGFVESRRGQLEYDMMQQTIISIIEADLVCFVTDSKVGITPNDQLVANFIRKYAKEQIVIANKSEKGFTSDLEYSRLGFGMPVSISAKHGQGIVNLYSAIDTKINTEHDEDILNVVSQDIIRIVVAGRPNVGKSTFVNSVVGAKRMLTGAEAGITRESIESLWSYKGYNMYLIDTSGLRKRANIKQHLEKMSACDTIDSIRFADTVILVLSAIEALEQQDLTIANYVINQGRSLVIVVNKWDLIQKKTIYIKKFEDKILHYLPQLKHVPVIYISALNSNNVLQTLDQCIIMYKLWNKKLSTSQLNAWLSIAITKHSLPICKKLGRRTKIKYITQVKSRPPTFKLFSNTPNNITDAYKKYLINSLRDNFNMYGVPMRMKFIKSNNPYIKKI